MVCQRIGHGGASALARANTLASFDAACEIGVDMVEFDVRAWNGELVLAHTVLHARRGGNVIVADMTRERGGRLLLRIEDIDSDRCRSEYEEAIYHDLRWLGLSWQEPVRRQSAHFADYEMAIGRLEAEGLLYPSFESRRELAALCDRCLRDIGVTRYDANREVRKPFWRA